MKHFMLKRVLLILLCTGFLLEASAAQASDWIEGGWTRRIEFSAEPDSISGGSFADFTLLLDLGAPGFEPVFAAADPAGSDLLITAADGLTVLSHERVTYDATGQTGEIWFKAPVFSTLENSFYLYYANDSLPAWAQVSLVGDSGDAWTEKHLAVYHFEEDPSLGVLNDSGPGMNDGTAALGPVPTGPGWTSGDRVPAAIGSGWQMDGVDEWIYADGFASTDSSFTISAWFWNSSSIDGGAMAFQADNTVWDISFQRTGGSPRPDLETPKGQVSWLPDIAEETMHHYAWVMDAVTDTVRFYFDGVEQEMWFRYTPPGQNGPVYSGESLTGTVGIASPYAYNSLDLSDGIVDEYRIVEGACSPGWVITEFRNQNDPGTFFVVGPEELAGGSSTATGPFATPGLGSLSVWPNPFRGVANLSLQAESFDVTVRVYDVQGRLVRTLAGPESGGSGALRFLWNGRDDRGTQVSNGTYYFRADNGRSAVSTKAILVR